MKKIFWGCSLSFSLLGFLLSCLDDIVRSDMPIAYPTIHDYLSITPSFRAVPYSFIGFIFGSLVFLILLFVKKLIQRRIQS
ncbi:hypothetical protein VR7878_01501 [Vibrio ruber DSM 16370]|uniref:Uncharacterized protein n=1 Tax=Vibrio ruber (strain DSM 16370 / JCM 11486 / BCRC 17186 / CECT 7878 / LMG 23124 / VR1) TaxID=1123498 RepID=A0A1R4LH48_VIBR1|nr:hypothetical protein VR7878_01501 [Vibrio ruber DSM 16370]